ncbi:MAG: hypothetical protein JHD16_14430, partial [Solirubrobacteraceae bacterium]|nr:hypothetical protein [Solirubrobacteraceae bacterium]
VEAEMGMPFAGLHELLLLHLDAREQIAEHHARAIGVALGLEPGEPQAPFALAVALLSLLSAVADESPAGVLVVVDDAQWLDDGSLDALLFAGRRLGAAGVVLLIAARPLPDRGLLQHGFPHLALDQLDAGDAEALVRAAAPDGLAAEPMDRLLAASDGNPLALVELASHLSPEQATGADALPDLLLPSDAIDGAFRAELDRVDPAMADALAVAAADERATRGELIAALQRLGVDPAALEAAEAARLVVAEGQRLTFRHPLLRSVAYHRAGGVRQRAAHAALAEVCEGEVRRARHLAAAADHPDESVAALVEQQAQAAVSRGALDAGALSYLRAAELTPDVTTRARRIAAAAQLYADLGQPERVGKLVDDVRTDAIEDLSVSVTLRSLRAAVTMRSGKLDEGYAQLLALVDELAPVDRAKASELLVMAGLRDRIIGNYEQMRSIAERARELAGDEHPVHRAFADVMLTIVLANTGDMPAADAALNRSFAVFDEHGYGDFSGELRSSASHALIWLGHLDRAEAYLAAHVDEERSRDALTALICPLNVQAQLCLRRGRLGAAYTQASESLTMAVDTRQYGYYAFAAGFLADAEALMGREAECREHAAAAIAIADSVGGAALSLWARSAIGLLELGLGRFEEAVVALEECRAISERIGLVEPSVVQWRGNHVEALIRLGQREEAEASLAAFERGVPSTWWSFATASRLRGMLAHEGDGIDDLEASISAFDAAGATIEAARSRLALGERLRRDRQRRAARKPLRQAMLAFEHAGAAPWAARAREELRATGESVAAGGAISTDDLTPHELRVALLVADGRTNPEVAAELYMARKTVEHHLSQIYRKLGLR